jgi:hypothetical protein
MILDIIDFMSTDLTNLAITVYYREKIVEDQIVQVGHVRRRFGFKLGFEVGLQYFVCFIFVEQNVD